MYFISDGLIVSFNDFLQQCYQCAENWSNMWLCILALLSYQIHGFVTSGAM